MRSIFSFMTGYVINGGTTFEKLDKLCHDGTVRSPSRYSEEVLRMMEAERENNNPRWTDTDIKNYVKVLMGDDGATYR